MGESTSLDVPEWDGGNDYAANVILEGMRLPTGNCHMH